MSKLSCKTEAAIAGAALALMAYLGCKLVKRSRAACNDSVYMVADVGGTNTRLQMWTVTAAGVETCVHAATVASKSAASLEALIVPFLADSPAAAAASFRKSGVAVCAVAGPVSNNTVQATNLPWPSISGDSIAAAVGGGRWELVNDFTAAAYGVLALQRSQVITLAQGAPVRGAPIAVIGAGSGLGEAFLTACPSGGASEYVAWPSEGGHSDFAPRNALEGELVRHLAAAVAAGQWHRATTAFGATMPPAVAVPEIGTATQLGESYTVKHGGVVRVSVERVVSGTGIPHVYAFVRSRFPGSEAPELAAALARPEAPAAALITGAALASASSLAGTAMKLWVAAYGAEAGNLALKTLPLGGLFLAGGIAGKIAPLLQSGGLFVEHMVCKGRMEAMLRKVPVHIIRHDIEVGLLGARVLACRGLSGAIAERWKGAVPLAQ